MFRPMNISKSNLKNLKMAADNNNNNKLYEPLTPGSEEGANGNYKNNTPNKNNNNNNNTDHNTTGRKTISENVIGDRSSNHLEIKSSNFSSANQKRLSIYQSPINNNNNHHHNNSLMSPLTNPVPMTIITSPVNVLSTPPNLSKKSAILTVETAGRLLSYLPENCVVEGRLLLMLLLLWWFFFFDFVALLFFELLLFFVLLLLLL